MNKEPQWLTWAKELQALAQTSLAYKQDPYDRERWQRARDIAAEILAAHSGETMDKVRDSFCLEQGYQTPKLDSRAAVFQGEKVLLVQEADGRWAMPGGWVDHDLTVRENTVKEALEESGLRVKPLRLVALQDRARHNRGLSAYAIQKALVLCENLGGEFVPNQETIASGWFALDDLPPLAEQKTSAEQISLCLKAAQSTHWETRFD